jgi:cardiolipin synthase
LSEYWPHLTFLTALDLVVIGVFVPWVLLTKRDPSSAVAWCLVVLFLPLFGALLFWVFGWNYLLHRVKHKRLSRALYRERYLTPSPEAAVPDPGDLGRIAVRVGAFPSTSGNCVTLYHATDQAFPALLQAIEAARHHVHLEFFILRSDETGQRLYDLLAQKAKEGVEVRLLYDAMGCLHLKRPTLRALRAAGVATAAFLPLNPLRSLVRVSLRNHRKIAVLDGRVAFTGGMNIGDEYLGKSARLGYWRDAFVRLEGPSAAHLQRVFCEDWEFAARQTLRGGAYFPPPQPCGSAGVQVAASGPDQEVNTIREIYFAAILSAQKRLFVSSPYLIPDAGLLDALRLARFRGVDVRVLSLDRPDHYVSYYAGRYFSAELLGMGVRLYRYRKGMMHAKLMMVDGRWAMVGSANLDNRSLHLNFEVGCILHDAALVADLEAAFERDLQDAAPLDRDVLAQRSLGGRVLDNACRLLAPTL